MPVVPANSDYMISSLTDKALHAFWEVILHHFQSAITGDLSFDRSLALQSSAEAAVLEWIANNVPGLQ